MSGRSSTYSSNTRNSGRQARRRVTVGSSVAPGCLDTLARLAVVNVRTFAMIWQAPAAAAEVAALAAALQSGSGGEPLHVQLEQALRELIRSGQLRPGAVLPGEIELAAHL